MEFDIPALHQDFYLADTSICSQCRVERVIIPCPRVNFLGLSIKKYKKGFVSLPTSILQNAKEERYHSHFCLCVQSIKCKLRKKQDFVHKVESLACLDLQRGVGKFQGIYGVNFIIKYLSQKCQ
jgi:hypothetical protein